MRGLWLNLLVVAALLVLGCGPEPGPVSRTGPVATMPPETVVWSYTPAPTSTAWPTFTPVPTPIPTAVPPPSPTSGPTPTPWPTQEAVATPEPGVTALPVLVLTPAPERAPTPAPTPYGKLPGAPVFFEAQTFFPLQKPELPERLRMGDTGNWPIPEEVVSQTTRFVVWAVSFDVSQVGDDFFMEGYVRWHQVTPTLEPLLMRETPVRLSKEMPFFYTGLGRTTPGFWNPGVYRLELLDMEYNSLVGWTFEVR